MKNDRQYGSFLEVALAGKAVCLVTGNLAHFPVSLRQGMKILSPGEFLLFCKKTRQFS
jgi:predicted nucleic acid-binding protein